MKLDPGIAALLTRNPDGLVPVLACEFAETVVFADEDDGEPVERRDVRCFVECAFVARAIAEEAAGDILRLAVLVREGCADRDRRPAADNSIGAEHAQVEVGDVHAAALALAVAEFASSKRKRGG